MKEKPMRTAIDTFDRFLRNKMINPCGYCGEKQAVFVMDPAHGSYRIRVACSNEACKLAAPVSLCEAEEVEDGVVQAVSAWNFIGRALSTSENDMLVPLVQACQCEGNEK